MRYTFAYTKAVMASVHTDTGCRVCGMPGRLCTGCRSAAYCSAEHQRIDRKRHKPHCNTAKPKAEQIGIGQMPKHRCTKCKKSLDSEAVIMISGFNQLLCGSCADMDIIYPPKPAPTSHTHR